MLWTLRPLFAALVLFVSTIGTANAFCTMGPSTPGPYCTDCMIPKGYTTLKCDPNAQCINKSVVCLCGPPGAAAPVRSSQPMCLYHIKALPTVKLPSQTF